MLRHSVLLRGVAPILTAKLPGRMKAIVKDVAVNLRSALDQAAYGSARAVGALDPSAPAFHSPIPPRQFFAPSPIDVLNEKDVIRTLRDMADEVERVVAKIEAETNRILTIRDAAKC